MNNDTYYHANKKVAKIKRKEKKRKGKESDVQYDRLLLFNVCVRKDDAQRDRE